jgi:cell division septal protein FtsQ
MKDYHKKSYTNPFFGGGKGGVGFSKGSRRRYGWRRKLIAFLFFILVSGLAYFIFFSPYFSINKIEISGLEKINYDEIRAIVDEQVASHRFFIFSQNNIFIFDEESAKNKLNEKYALNLLKINKSLPGVIKVFLEEKKPALVWKTAEKFYLIDWEGVVIREITETEVSEYPGNQPGAKMAVVFDDSNASLAIKNKILTSEAVQTINELQNNLSRTTRLLISNFSMANHNDSTIKVRTSEGWDIYFSLTNDLNAQIVKLSAFLVEKNLEERKGLQYVDLRFEDRVYYK